MFLLYFHYQRKLKKALKMDGVDSSSGILLPFYDHDTKIVFLAGKVGLLIFCIVKKMWHFFVLLQIITYTNNILSIIHKSCLSKNVTGIMVELSQHPWTKV